MLRYAVFILGTASLFGQTDASIPLSFKPPVFKDPLDIQQQSAIIQRLMLENAIRAEELKRVVQERAQAEELRRLQIENQVRTATQPAPAPKAEDGKPSDDAATQTQGMYNGRFWKQLSPGEKIMFVVGFSNGVGVTSGADFEAYVPGKLTNGEIAEGLDRFYIEPENLLVPMCISVEILAKKASGADPAAIDSLIAAVRRVSLQPLDVKPAK